MIRVKGMGGIACSQHHIVGNVHQSVDGTHPGFPDTVLHLIGRGLYLHAGHFHPDVAGAAVRILNLHLKIRLHIRLKGLDLL